MSKGQIVFLVIAAAAVALVVFVWVKFYRVVPDKGFTTAEERFQHGVVSNAGAPEIPYWIWLVLPRIVPDLLSGPGGYPTLGIAWNLGEELPIGFSKRTAGYPRVGTNCALCHTVVEGGGELENPKYILVKRPSLSTLNAYLEFLKAAAKDDRFNADAIMGAGQLRLRPVADGQAALPILDYSVNEASVARSSYSHWRSAPEGFSGLVSV
jgi:hypothetical protein